jgi:hypothetical protein
MSDQVSLDDLRKRHAALYREFLPKLDGYTKMAKEAVEIQEQIYRIELAAAFPGATWHEDGYIASISVRDTPPNVSAALDALHKQDISVSLVVFDRQRMEFKLFGKKTT